MPKKKSSKKKGKKKGSGKKKGVKKGAKASATGPLSVSEQGLRSREYLRLHVEDLKHHVERLKASNERLAGEYHAAEHVGRVSTEQLREDLEYHRRENLRHVDMLEEERRRWIEGTANLREHAANLEKKLEEERAKATAREDQLKEEIVALNQKLSMLEEFRDQEHSIRRQLADTRLQLKQSEAMHAQEREDLERKLVEQQGQMAASMDEKIARVARAFKLEADSRLDDRARVLASQNASMSKMLMETTNKVNGVVQANEDLRRQVQALKIELQVADDARKTLSTTARKNSKVAAAMRERYMQSEEAVRELEAKVTETEANMGRMRDEYERHITALQRTIEATQRSRREVASVDDLDSLDSVTALIDWTIASVESHFLQWQATEAADGVGETAAACHRAQMAALMAARKAAPAVVDRVIDAQPPLRATAVRGVGEVAPSVRCVGVQAGASGASTGSFGASLGSPPLTRAHGAGRRHQHASARYRQQRATAHSFGLDVYALAAAVQAPPPAVALTARP